MLRGVVKNQLNAPARKGETRVMTRRFTMRAPTLRLTIRRGDLAQTAAAALITSANDALVGNTQPMYWRFISRVNADGAVRKAAGSDLERHCLAIEPLASPSHVRRDITRWTSGVKHGTSKHVRCPAGSAVITPATGQLQADNLVHAVAPDSEFGYEGMYTGGRLDQEVSGAVPAGPDTVQRYAWQQFTPPDDLLLSAYTEALRAAFVTLDATDVASPALGCGVKGWKPSISCALGLEAVARTLLLEPPPRASSTASSPSSLQFVVGGYGPVADACWTDWVRVARLLLGAPSGLEDPAEYAAEAARAGSLTWTLSSEALAQQTGMGASPSVEDDVCADRHGAAWVLPLGRVPQMQEMWQFRRQGYSGKDEPLTAEQELAATRRRSTR